MTDSDQAATEPPVPVETWSNADLSELLHDFADQVEITIDIVGGRLQLQARPRPRPSLRLPAGLQPPPVAVAWTPAGLRLVLMEKGYVPWTD